MAWRLRNVGAVAGLAICCAQLIGPDGDRLDHGVPDVTVRGAATRV
ncbi:MAG: hypothetical protein AVDCRST_MAG65-2367 [uncultured Solirubrobacteraceae bacterium]|uniref:Uncharacterized protein n=1 Tax=uncultured Solirubrobacteraceae bacterium TaxID=1162706 RepID=A0A6J4SEJ5_9ACTN|nr:MAG: hypothetical protein AVDCRST_MAG65-2367 [uncultured Solirubrobacteraceae bacterium]